MTRSRDENLQVIEVEVIAHSDNKEKIYQALEECDRDLPLAIEYMGQVPEDIAFIIRSKNISSLKTAKCFMVESSD